MSGIVSAICGICSKGISTNKRDALALMSGFDRYRFDKTGSFTQDPVFLGCHQNCVTPESLEETLPYEDKETSLVITADAIIDNRDELFGIFAIPVEEQNMPDSILILEAYKKWGAKCPEYLVGDFAFAIWDKQKSELFLARDHVGKRSLYYYDSPDIFAFSTLMEPLFKISGVNKHLNETYIADFLAITSIRHELSDEMTIYEGVFNLPPASAMLVSKNGIKKWCYWEIKKAKEIHFDTDAEYEEAFRKVYSEAVNCRLRSVKKVGILLSGGLDSGSVACLAAPELKKRNEKLYSFTQVPMKGYKDWLPESKLADEREYVEEVCAYIGNIEPHYIASEGKSPLTEINERLKTLEQPYKTFENAYWGNACFKTAHDMGLDVLLSGQSGNATVSWGNFNSYMIYLLKNIRLNTFLKEIRAYSKRQKTNPLRLILGIGFNFMPYRIKKHRYIKKNGQDFSEFLSPINPQFAKAMKVEKRFKKYKFDPLFIAHGDSFTERMKMLVTSGFSHLGAIETKSTLAFGVEKRDPTRDKRVIEFCINLPENQWVRDGEERRFIRHAMKGYMPDMVRLNTTVRGRQAADWMQRIAPEWAAVYKEMETIGDNELERKYLDIPRIKRFLAANKELSPDDNDGTESGVRLLIRALIFTRFLRSFEGQN
ncbi:MAG: asparagine synthase-related protein [Bacillota bacterium]|nr:asparagine synthase-related protein [Bacillota bacterium]